MRHMRLTGTYDSYVRMYDYLMHAGGLDELSITRDDEDYYYNPKDYVKYKALKKSGSANEYLYWDKLRLQDEIKDRDNKLREAKKTIRKLKRESRKIKASKAYKYAVKFSKLKKAVTGK